eukprot:gnl/TRDRNA2_/TRDRNA2_155886_c0_seq3.p1 gnl/TRDRNA2_/TRDRNA2_155886_c0~~gnl/TRDRNA2_/TRDRNA2_155886_c0_seq3.p1  ORF type:complete len:407 (+),score=75.13 gnl/TRDRNA2_/TRDRNA2_155886_c0_seq3:138-1358(+)
MHRSAFVIYVASISHADASRGSLWEKDFDKLIAQFHGWSINETTSPPTVIPEAQESDLESNIRKEAGDVFPRRIPYVTEEDKRLGIAELEHSEDDDGHWGGYKPRAEDLYTTSEEEGPDDAFDEADHDRPIPPARDPSDANIDSRFAAGSRAVEDEQDKELREDNYDPDDDVPVGWAKGTTDTSQTDPAKKVAQQQRFKASSSLKLTSRDWEDKEALRYLAKTGRWPENRPVLKRPMSDEESDGGRSVTYTDVLEGRRPIDVDIADDDSVDEPCEGSDVDFEGAGNKKNSTAKPKRRTKPHGPESDPFDMTDPMLRQQRRQTRVSVNLNKEDLEEYRSGGKNRDSSAGARKVGMYVPPAVSLIQSSLDIGVPAAALVSLFTGSGVTFAMLRFSCESTTGMEPLLVA